MLPPPLAKPANRKLASLEREVGEAEVHESKLIIAIGALVLLAACDTETLQTFEDKPAVIRVEAGPDVCWSGAIGNSTKEGCGTREFRVQEAITVANVQKQGKAGKLSLVLEIDGEVVDRATTTASYGIAEVSE